MLNEAITYARRGWHVFPLSPNTKVPKKNSKGFKDATNKINLIKQIWQENPRYNIGIATGHISNLLVLDVDDKGEKHGTTSLEILMDEHSVLPDTVAMRTPSGSKQLWFTMPEDIHISISADKLGDGLDIRANGGYTLAPPSYVTANGKYQHTGPYQFYTDQSPEEIDLATPPDWLINLLIQEEPKSDPFLHIQKQTLELPIQLVVSKYNLKLTESNDKLVGSHPIHGSSNGVNFHIDLEKGLWHCFRHNTGGNALSLIAMLEGIIECPCCIKGGLSGQAFKETINIAINSFDFDPRTLSKDAKGIVWDRCQDGKLKSTFNNTKNLFLENEFFKDLYYNEFSEDVYFNNDPLQDDHLIIMKDKLGDFGVEPALNIIYEACKSIALKNKRNPLKEYLENLRWDGVPRLESWLKNACGVNESLYTKRVAKMTLVAAVARVYNPGHKYDHMLILEGPQGIKKSTAIRELNPDTFKKISLTDHDKDTVQMLRGGWIVEVDELAVFAKKDIQSLKAFITREFDEQRFAYDRRITKVKRKFILIGSINPEEGYLTDTTGNRRFFPVEVNNINIEYIKENKDQLFAESVVAYKNGYKTFLDSSDSLDKEIIYEANIEQSARESHDEWLTIIENFLIANKLDMSSMITVKDIYVKALHGSVEKLGQRESRRIGNLLQRLGGIKPKGVTRENGVVGRYFDITHILECNDVDAHTDVGWNE